MKLKTLKISKWGGGGLKENLSLFHVGRGNSIEKNRKTGIDILGDVSWGTHFCLFYQTKEDLTDILVPYFKAGLENNEFCIWITSKPLSEREAKTAIRKAVPNFNQYLKKGQIEIIPHTEWYLKGGTFNLQRSLNAWSDKLNQALAKGYDGIRVTGNAAWLEKKNWKNFADYEATVNNAIEKYRMIAICPYPLDRCGASEIIDVVSNHQFALIMREGKWELIESSEIKQTKKKLLRTKNYLQNIIESSPDIITVVDMKGDIISFNKTAEEVTGYKSEQVIGTPILDFYPAKEKKRALELWKTVLEKGKVKDFETNVFNKNKELIPIKLSISLLRNGKGQPVGTVGISRDLREIKDLKQKLKKIRKKESVLTENEKSVLYGLIRYPFFNDQQLSEKIRVKRSTITSIKNKLKRNGFYSVYNLPNFKALGCELLAFTFGKTTPSKRMKINTKKVTTIPGVIIKTDTEYLYICVSKNITDFRKNISPLLHDTETNVSDTTTFFFPYELSKIFRFVDFAPVLKHSLKLNIKDEQRKIKNVKKRKLTKNEKMVLCALTKYPELNDKEIAKKINKHRPTVTMIRNRLINDGFLQRINVLDLTKLGYELLVFSHREFTNEIDTRKVKHLTTMKNSPSVILAVQGDRELATISVYKNYDDFRTIFDKHSELCSRENILIKKPTTLVVLPLKKIKIQNLNLSPILERLFNLDVNF